MTTDRRLFRAVLAAAAVVIVAAGVAVAVLLTNGRQPVEDPSGMPPPTVGAPYTSSWVDDFTGDQVNRADWAVYDTRGTASPRGPKSASLTTVTGGVLTLRVARVGGVWTGSGVASRRLHFTYGEVLIRARYSRGYGAKAVALLWPEHGWPPEIDFFETDTTDPAHTRVGLTNHYSPADRMQHNYVTARPCWHCYPLPGFNPADGHTYGVQWTRGGVTYTVDQQPVATQLGHAPRVRMWLGLSNNLGRGDAKRPDASTPSTVDFDVDWVDYLTT
jgi:beta-glucanase (GH16 family)